MTPNGLVNLNIPGATGGEPKLTLKKLGNPATYEVDMTQEMGGNCITAAKYKTDAAKLLTDTYQCGHWNSTVPPQAVQNGNYFGGKGKQIVVPNMANNEVVRNALMDWANLRPIPGNDKKLVTVDQLNNLEIYTTGQAIPGTMCAMPGPPGRMEDFWEKCVMPKGGYFNLAYCEENGASAVLGLAFVESNMCYPAHMHIAEEAYWQVAGSGKWKKWHSEKSTAEMKIVEGGLPKGQRRGEKLLGKEVEIGAPGGKHFHPATLAHEFSTDSGQFMIMVYWWGMGQNTAPNDYRFVRETMAGDQANSGCAKDFFTVSESDQQIMGRRASNAAGTAPPAAGGTAPPAAGGREPQVPFDSALCKANIFTQEGAASIFSYCGGCCDQKHWMYKTTVFSGCATPSACKVSDCCIAKSPPPPAPPAPVSADMTCKEFRGRT